MYFLPNGVFPGRSSSIRTRPNPRQPREFFRQAGNRRGAMNAEMNARFAFSALQSRNCSQAAIKYCARLLLRFNDSAAAWPRCAYRVSAVYWASASGCGMAERRRYGVLTGCVLRVHERDESQHYAGRISNPKLSRRRIFRRAIDKVGHFESSVGFQPAVSPISNRQSVATPSAGDPSAHLQAGSTAIQQVGSLRYDSIHSPGTFRRAARPDQESKRWGQ